IDREYLEKSRIGFAYAPGSNADSVAEYVVAALAVMTKRKKREFADLRLGIVGVGNIGSRVFKHALALGMQTLLCDPPKQRLTRCETYRSLDDVLAAADVVSLHVPLVAGGPERTLRMVDASFIRRMKRGALLINTSRGKVADEEELLNCRDHLGGLVLDVWDNEPAIRTDLVEAADLATPHIAGYSFDGKIRGTQMIYDAACAWFFCKPQWRPFAESSDEPAEAVDVEQGADRLRHAILQAYPIEEDDRRFKRVVSLGRDERSRYFDDLRKNYPKRREFSHFSLKSRGCPGEVIDRLKRLGFQVGD
ncbi:MAG: 4-phosphoerythronate dehydrogenase, partial [Chitinispirillaceae bacterium]|nr:4-phosphoerythronate dehydrogenase [Chitinispirillaceae bacterium]